MIQCAAFSQNDTAAEKPAEPAAEKPSRKNKIDILQVSALNQRFLY